MELDLSTDFFIKIGKDVDRISKGMQRRWVSRKLANSLTITNNNGTINFGSPALGKLWNPVALSINGAAFPFAPPAALSQVTFGIGDSANPMAAEIIWSVNAAPWGDTFGTEALWATNSEDMYVNVAATNGTTVVGVLHVREYSTDDILPGNLI